MNNVSGFLAAEAFIPLLNSLWQAAAIVALVWLGMRFLQRLNAATRYAIWWAVLGAVLLLPLVPRRQSSQPAPAIVRSSTGGATNPLLPELEIPAMVHIQPASPPRWPLAIAALWIGVFLYRSTCIAQSFIYLRRVKAGAFASADPIPPTGRHARLLLSSDISSPIAVGFWKPAVILPLSLPSDLDKADFDHVVLHEAAHLARMDDWTNLAARALAAVLALHPIALWILRRIEREREMACDEWVVARTGQARNYAVSLARMYELRWARSDEVLASGVFGRKSCLVERIELLVARGRDFSSRLSAKRVVFSTIVLLAFVAAGARSPLWIAFAQKAPRPSFDAASIKPGDSADRRFGIGRRGNVFQAMNAPLKLMIGFAYDVQAHQISGGPKWIDSDRFTIEARPSATAAAPGSFVSMDTMKLMVQSLLEERFKVVLHRDTRIEQVYELVVAKGGTKLKESAGPVNGREGIFGRGMGSEAATNLTLPSLAGHLSQRLGRSVIDKTGLTGKYDFILSFMPEQTQQDLELFGPLPPEAVPPADSGLPSIFTAVQDQLGLKLESAKGPVEVLVVDRAEKPEPD